MKLDELKDIVPLTPQEMDTYRSYPIERHPFVVYDDVLPNQQQRRTVFSTKVVNQFQKFYGMLF